MGDPDLEGPGPGSAKMGWTWPGPALGQSRARWPRLSRYIVWLRYTVSVDTLWVDYVHIVISQ